MLNAFFLECRSRCDIHRRKQVHLCTTIIHPDQHLRFGIIGCKKKNIFWLQTHIQICGHFAISEAPAGSLNLSLFCRAVVQVLSLDAKLYSLIKTNCRTSSSNHYYCYFLNCLDLFRRLTWSNKRIDHLPDFFFLIVFLPTIRFQPLSGDLQPRHRR